MAHETLASVLVAASVLLAVAVAGGEIARRRGLPAIVGELAGGLGLGPTVLGRLLPDVHGFLFPSTGPAASARHVLLSVGLLGFLFVAGLELDLSRLRGHLSVVACVSACGLLVPFALGAMAVLALPSFFGGALPPAMMAVFLGTALSISALPVIARTLMDLGLHGSRLAALVLSAAAIDDVIGWSLFAFLSRQVTGAAAAPLASLASAVLLVGLALTAGRAVVVRLRPRIRAWLPAMPARLALAAAVVLGLAALAEGMGVHAVLGGFLAGVVLAQGPKREDVHDVCHALGTGVLAPMYFASIGQRADFAAHLDVGLTALVIAIACAGKIGAAAIAGRMMGLPARESLALGAALNARGAMEILLAGVALEQRMIDERLFVALVVMALATSLMSGPLLLPLVRGMSRGSSGPATIPATAS